jgi:hypothetical protein
VRLQVRVKQIETRSVSLSPHKWGEGVSPYIHGRYYSIFGMPLMK